MSITCFLGPMGCGKTTLAVALAEYYRETREKEIMSNMHLNIPYRSFTLESLAEEMASGSSELVDVVILLDETYQMMDSRTSSTKMNRLLSYFIVQARKRDVELITCSHAFRSLDIRLRAATDEKGTAHYIEENPCKLCKGVGTYQEERCYRCNGYGKTGYAYARIYSRAKYTTVLFEVKNTSLIWPLFDTKERVPLRADTFTKLSTKEIGQVREVV